MTAAFGVPDLLRRGAQAPAYVSPVDAVMGEDWAHLELGRGGAERRLTTGGAGRLGPDRRRRAIGGVLAPNPQALVKLIGTGGTATKRGLRAQMDYLSRQGDVPLVSSESTFGAELEVADAEQIAAAWGLPDSDRSGADRTSHFVVSFPQGTDPEAAERAGRAWAAALFDSGAHGDRWDYYTAFHKDTAYPHIHVVVGRRGLDAGTWLRVSGRGELTFDRLREVQVAVAAREGIALTGTSRLSRGVHDRPIPDAELRRARAAGRAPVVPAHTRASAVAAAAEVLEHARAYEGAAATLQAERPSLADRLEAAAQTILEGRQLVAERDAQLPITTEEAIRMAQSIEEKQAEARQNFVELDEKVAQVPDAAQRSSFMRRVAELKGKAAPLIRDDLGLQTYRPETPHADYRGMVIPERASQAAVAIKEAAAREVARLAERFDLQPDAAVARHAAPTVSLGLGEEYHAQEHAERAAGRAAHGEPPERADEARAQLAEFHRRAAVIYREAAERLRELERDDPRGERQRPETRTVSTSRTAPGRDEAAPPARARPARRRERDDDERSR